MGIQRDKKQPSPNRKTGRRGRSKPESTLPPPPDPSMEPPEWGEGKYQFCGRPFERIRVGSEQQLRCPVDGILTT